MPASLHRERLTTEQYALAFRLGRGEAFLNACQFGLAEIDELLIHACTHEPRYDAQCEPSRAQWLFDLIKASPDYERYVSAIKNALEHETEDEALNHLCHLALLIANDGDVGIATRLETRVLGQNFVRAQSPFGCEIYVRYGGLPAILALTKKLGEALLIDPEDWQRPLDDFTEDKALCALAWREVRRLAERDVAYKTYLDGQQIWDQNHPPPSPAQRKQMRHEQIRSELPIELMLASALARKYDHPGRYRTFGLHATAHELNQVFERLLLESDPAVCTRLLWVFSQVELPELHENVWTWCNSQNDELRHAAITAIAGSKNPVIGELAQRRLLTNEYPDDLAILCSLLVRNYRPNDELILLLVISRIEGQTDDQRHRVHGAIIDVIESNPLPIFFDALFEIYMRTPCSHCRASTVELMLKLGVATDTIIEACRHDANENIRQLVAAA